MTAGYTSFYLVQCPLSLRQEYEVRAFLSHRLSNGLTYASRCT